MQTRSTLLPSAVILFIIHHIKLQHNPVELLPVIYPSEKRRYVYAPLLFQWVCVVIRRSGWGSYQATTFFNILWVGDGYSGLEMHCHFGTFGGLKQHRRLITQIRNIKWNTLYVINNMHSCSHKQGDVIVNKYHTCIGPPT